MISAGIFFIELLILFFLSKYVTRKLAFFFYRVTRSKNISIYLLSFLFFPGTVLHELSHFLMAGLLRVQVHHIEFIPQIEGEHVKLGSVSISHCDPVRRFFIGVAPFMMGTALLLGVLFYAIQNELFKQPLFAVLLGYLSFEISNTMFSSKKDMEGAIELIFTVGTLVLIFSFLNLSLPFTINDIFTPKITNLFIKGSLFLLIPLCIDFVLFLLFSLVFRKHT
jgi:hypothetical protein